jgi:hypothetical protein
VIAPNEAREEFLGGRDEGRALASEEKGEVAIGEPASGSGLVIDAAGKLYGTTLWAYRPAIRPAVWLSTSYTVSTPKSLNHARATRGASDEQKVPRRGSPPSPAQRAGAVRQIALEQRLRPIAMRRAPRNAGASSRTYRMYNRSIHHTRNSAITATTT